MHSDLPNLVQDRFWDKQNVELPYTKESEPFRVPEYQGSAVPSQKLVVVIRPLAG